MLKHFDGNDSVKGVRLEVIVDNVTRDYGEVVQTLGGSLLVDVLLLKPGVGKCRDSGMWKYLGEVECTRAPATASSS